MRNILTETVFGEKLNQKMTLCEALTLLQEKELLNAGELAEKAVSMFTGIAQTSRCQSGYDLINGWEIKHGQTHQLATSSTRTAYVAGLKNKTDTIRVIITEQFTGKLYFFKIPHSAYIPHAKSSISWSFNKHGTPNRIKTSGTRENFWNYEVNTFAELCS